MDSKKIIYLSACFILAVSTVSALNCIQCSMYLDYNDNSTNTNDNTTDTCDKRKNGTGTPCAEGEVCSTQYNPVTKLLTRGCDKKEICKNVPENYNCSTCSSDLCQSSSFQIHPVYAPIVACLLFATLSR
ncbi:uncharacterized protein LOC123684730 [Harmonia axyridis]|uniref:uncharacterized protein LOC123684730 n=1 Tax=Harmonia axyridis TaxID=115357 RepID=UPI001E27797C|nr:uncharacterized protein LOC123684730 [Harmonia axyridis]